MGKEAAQNIPDDERVQGCIPGKETAWAKAQRAELGNKECLLYIMVLASVNHLLHAV